MENRSTVLRVVIHKTAQFGSYLFFLNETDARTLESYIRYYRILAIKCCSQSCYVFPNKAGDDCCSKMSLANIGRLVSKTVNRAGQQLNINSRMLRRTQITELWQS